jgi:hypothetical protein
MTKENSVSTDMVSPSESHFPSLRLITGVNSVFDNDSDDQLSTGDLLEEQHQNIKRKRANSNCIKLTTDPLSGQSAKADEYQKKFKTEICKNFQFKGFCQWGDVVR